MYERFSDLELEELYGSYRSLARSSHERGDFALEVYYRRRVVDVTTELSTRARAELESQHEQMVIQGPWGWSRRVDGPA